MSMLLFRVLNGWLHPQYTDAGLQRLASLLEVPIDDLISAPTSPQLCYRSFTIRKRDGRKRQIAAPSGTLKRLQRRFLRRYLAQQSPHHAATAFRPGHSIATHARRHLGQAIVLTVDLADFFASTEARRIRCWFAEQGWYGEALRVLMRLCVFRGGLPQGAPTSPALSNLVNWRLDEELTELAAIHSARYSRYSDDLAFSWSGESEPAVLRTLIEEKLRRYGYRIQPSKGWRLQRAYQRPEITGLTLDGRRLRLPDKIVMRIREIKRQRFNRDASVTAQLQGYRGLSKMLK